jgi:hypothetical protein
MRHLQGIYDAQVWEGAKLSRRAMHEAVFVVGWDAEGLLPRHRAVIAPEHQGPGRAGESPPVRWPKLSPFSAGRCLPLCFYQLYPERASQSAGRFS